MKEFINEFGKENFIIIIAVVGAIVLALIIIVLIEKFQIKSKMKKQVKKQISNINMAVNNMPRPVISREKRENKKPKENIEILNSRKKDEVISSNNVIDRKPNMKKNVEILKPKKDEEMFNTKNDNEVVYVEEKNSRKEAKQKLEEVTKRLIDNDDSLIDHTHFETEQEEKSIISYEELIKASHDIDDKNDKLLEDEGEAAITLEELYQKHVDEQNEVVEEKVSNPVFNEEEPRKFKNSAVISPVFGVYNGKTKQTKRGTREAFRKMSRKTTSENKDLENEIKETEDFLTELKKLKSKLD